MEQFPNPKVSEAGRDEERSCRLCQRKYVWDSRKGHTQTVCNSCMANRRRFAVKDRALAYKGGCCVTCGYSRCKRALGFHHVDDHSKEFGLAGNHGRAWKWIQAELDKCVLLCANCHAEVHAGIRSLDNVQ